MPEPDDHRTEPRVPPTRASTLIVAGLLTAAVSWLLISRYYTSFPTPPVLPGITLFALAILEFGAAANTKARIDRKRGAQPVDPLLVARFVVLAKASALAAALFTGAYAGISTWLLTERGHLPAAERDLPLALIGLVGSIALVTAGLLLERACRVPPPPPGEGGPAGRADEVTPDTEDAGS
jgi:hypothetical protein